jgi:hypothetical protein
MLSVCPPINFRMAAPIITKLGMYVLYHGTSEHLNGIRHKSLLTAFVSMCAPIVPRQQLGKIVTSATNTHATIEELMDALFYMRFMSYQGKQATSSSENFLPIISGPVIKVIILLFC